MADDIGAQSPAQVIEMSMVLQNDNPSKPMTMSNADMDPVQVLGVRDGNLQTQVHWSPFRAIPSLKQDSDLANVTASSSLEQSIEKGKVVVLDNNGESDYESDEGDEVNQQNTCRKRFKDSMNRLADFKTRLSPTIIRGLKYILAILYFCYFGYAMYHEFGTEPSLRLLVCTIIGLLVFSHRFIRKCTNSAQERLGESKVASWMRRISRWFLYIAMVVFAVVYTVMNVVVKKPENLTSLAGMIGYLIISCFMSRKFSKIAWRAVFWGISFQFLLAIVVLRTSWGFQAVSWASDRVTELLNYGHISAEFVFGKTFRDHILVFDAFPLILFINSFITVLYHAGVMEWVVTTLGRFLAFTLSCTQAESMSVAANIFLGNAQACLAIRPYLAGMSSSEVFALMTGGFASVSTSSLGLYIQFGADPRHLITACIMSAPASLAVSKIIYPERRKMNRNKPDYNKAQFRKYNNVLEAATSGASDSVMVFVQVLVNIYVFYALLQFLDTTIGWFGQRVGIDDFSFQYLCSYLFFPLPLLMGASIEDCRALGQLLGVKMVASETVAFLMLGQFKRNNADFLEYTLNPNNTWHYVKDDIVLEGLNKTLVHGVLTPRSVAIATYALCSYSGFINMGVAIGTMQVLIPTKKNFLSRIMFLCFIAGSITSYLTACIAGLFFEA